MTPRRIAGATLAATFSLIATPLVGAAGAATSTPPGTYAVYCSAASATAFTGCYVDGQTTPLTVPAGSSITTDPVVPSTAGTTSGLVSPDGILGVIPSSAAPAGLGIPANATTFLYIEKQVNYFDSGTVGATETLPLTTPTNIPTSTDYSGFGAGTYYLGGGSGIDPVNCTGSTPTSLTGCTSPTGQAADTVSSGATLGAPNACVTPGSVLQEIGEGSTSAKKLYKNNEDFAQVRLAYTTDGTTFHDVTPSGGISGLANPYAQSGFRWVAPGGTVIANPDGSLGLFFSEGQCTDGDSDAFGSMEYSTSTDGGLTWSAPQQIADGDTAYGTGTLSTDYTFGASIASQKNGTPLDVSAYYEGRIYSPSVVPHYSGSTLTGLTMTFAGYRTSKPLPSTGSGVLPLGRASETSTSPAAIQYTPAATDPALYRNILTVQLTPVVGSGTDPHTNPTTYVAGTPVVAQVQNGPWTTAQGDPGASGTEAPYGPNGDIAANGGTNGTYTTFTPGGGPTNTIGGVTYPNMSTYPGAGATGTATPYTTGYAGTPGPLAGYCGTGGTGSTANVSREPAGFEPMSPYYFPHIEANPNGSGLIGFFDYRPKDTDEAMVFATSQDNGATWTYQTEALELSTNHCADGNSDKALQTTTDDGEGHAYDMMVNGTDYLYTVNRSNGTLDTLGSQFLVHPLNLGQSSLGLPASEPVGTGSTTTSTGTNTVTATPGGVSTSTFTVASTAGFNEIPGRIYVTVGPGAALPEAPLGVALPAAAAGLFGLGAVVLRRRKRDANA